MNRGQIGSVIELERDALDELLDGLVRFGLLRLAVEDGIRVYRAVCGRSNIPEWCIGHAELVRFRNCGLLPLWK